jgi:NifU-like protein involved in Fe-S cluster formation/Fe-S cluster biogenesis protein NfuA/bacterioferritin-associated ferredoxin
MGMDNLIGGTIWDEYSQKVTDLMNNPKNMGEITQERADEMGAKLIVADFGAESCGDAVRLYWAVDPKTDIILESKFKSFGCGTAIASSDTMAELCSGKTVDEAVKITNIDVEHAMRDNPDTPAVPPQKMHCSPYFMPVLTPKGKVQIGEIREGDEVAVYTKNGLENTKVKRVISYKVPKDDLVRVYLKTESNGIPAFFVFTKDHKLLDNQGQWIEVQDLKDGDNILKSDNLTIEIDKVAELSSSELTQEKIEIDDNDMAMVYTLEVEHTEHNYIQNGVISKNCSVMAYDVIKKAAGQYKGVDMESFEEEVIVCECARVTLSTLREVIRLNDLTTIEQITDYTKAGAFCKSCIRPGGHEAKDIYLVDLLEEYEKEKMTKSADASASGANMAFVDMTVVQKLKAVDKVIDENIRQMLIMDGGDMEILDIKENGANIDIYIRYLGACNGCASSSTGTLFAIENILKEKLDENIRVLPI